MSQSRTPPKNAVALHYDGKRAPRITAKGRGAVAEEIIALAREHGVPLHEDRELVALLAQLELNDEIPRELYLAVAEVIAFAYMVTEKFPPGWGPDGKL
ncbi:EscU/YscU/HrcU family type III secretion system export apparatus switch protein [Sulfurivermis fontis]|jgi:flagellar biosynthesis protein|uniref:EscU/YscU/HrcU family type III secretion system export apparatus switch protein n=1 Tax=Sulfurivermis fontis TaxID=1972068 RepID=UPI000FDB4EEA|nr:EscU/YscU/HrcU family type III secretion system export apparatus switch protein [Sulfurivermis fontis]